MIVNQYRVQGEIVRGVGSGNGIIYVQKKPGINRFFEVLVTFKCFLDVVAYYYGAADLANDGEI